MEEKDEIIISPKVIGDVLKKNVVFIIVTVLLFSLGSFFYTNFFVTKQYTAKSLLYVETTGASKENTNAAAYNLNMQTYAQRLVATYIKMLGDTNSFYNELSESLNERYTASELKKMISFKSDEDTEIFEVRVVASSPTEAKRIADAVDDTAPSFTAQFNSDANLKVVDRAEVPTAPSSPNTTRNVAIAIVLGVALSFAISFIRHFADKKIKYNEEITEILDIPILAAIPNFDSYINQKSRK